MTAELEKPRDVVGGLVTMAIGAGFLLVGQELEFGTSFRMGPGYFPTILSLLMIALGAVLTGLAWRAQPEEGAFGHIPWRGLLLVIGATLFFGFTLRGLGLAPVLVLIVLATAWASRYATWRSSAPLALGLAVFCTVLFIRLLGLPLPLLGSWADPQRWWAASPVVEAPAPAWRALRRSSRPVPRAASPVRSARRGHPPCAAYPEPKLEWG